MFQEFVGYHKKVYFFTLSETLLPSNNSNSENPPNFYCCRFLSRNRHDGKSGGEALHVKKQN